MTSHLLALLLALIIDRMIGDPRSWPHPVVWIGTLISKLERRLNNGENRRQKGIAMLVVVLITVFVLSYGVMFVAYSIHMYVGIFIEAILIAATIATKSLKEAAEEVYEPLCKEDVEEARRKLSYIVGRDTEHLTEEEIVRATVETVAENTSDGITAPLFYACIGGAPLALLYRAINTCDSMVGYKNEKYEQFGWASAKCDDVVNYIPSRLTALITIFIHSPKIKTWNIVKREAPKHLSPNSGWGEAAVATILGVELGGKSTYNGVVIERATIGINERPIVRNDIIEAIRIMLRTVMAFVFVLFIVGGVFIVIT